MITSTLSDAASLEGLAWAFLAAGAGQVMTSRYPVHDLTAARFMARFYALLADLPPAQALARARHEGRKAGMPLKETAAWGIWG